MTFGTAASYDIFVVHAAKDERFVLGYLLPALALPVERVQRLQTLELGGWTADEIERAVQSSRVTILVLSPAYLDDHWARLGAQLAAHASALGEANGSWVPLLLEDCKLTMHVEAFQKLDFRDRSPDAWQRQIDRLRTHLGAPGPTDTARTCPYPGMRDFTEDEAGRFFGRDAECDAIVRRLSSGRREICIVGASGSGKSSLLAAAVVPRLARGEVGLPRYHVCRFRPGKDPLARLTVALEGDVTAETTVIDELLARNSPASSVLLVIDQLEELFALTSDSDRRRFLAALQTVRADPRCTMLFALRSDFYDRFRDSSLVTDLEGRTSRIPLDPLRGERLQESIERPARAADVYFERELVSQLLDEADEPGALPLLQETLVRLWKRRRQCLIALADYRAPHGGRATLSVGLEEHADEVYERMTEAQQEIALRILLRLVAFGEGRPDTRRQQPREALRSVGESEADFAAALQCLIGGRLLTIAGHHDVSDATHNDSLDVRVDLAHEVMIRAWTTFASWIRKQRGDESERRGLEESAAAWRRRGSKEGGLLDRDELADACRWRHRAARRLGHSADVAALLDASSAAQDRERQRHRLAQDRERQRHRLAWLIGIVVPLLLVFAVVVLLYANRVARQRDQRKRDLAESAQLYQDVGWQRWSAERPLQALPYLLEARRLTEASDDHVNESLLMLFRLAERTPPVSRQSYPGSVLAVTQLDHVDMAVVAQRNVAAVWFANEARPAAELLHFGSVMSAAFSADATRLATASSDAAVRIWDLTANYKLSLILQHSGVRSAEFSHDGARIVTAGDDGMVRLWDAANGSLMRTIVPTRAEMVAYAAFDARDSRIVTAAKDGTIKAWDASTGAPAPIEPPQHVLITSLGPHSSAEYLIGAHSDGPRREGADEQRVIRLQHDGPVRSIAFSRDGMRIVTASEDKTARVWDAVTGEPLSSPLEHLAVVTSARFSAGGSRVITTSEDGATQEWDVPINDLAPRPMHHESTISCVAFSRDGAYLVSASRDWTARVWDAATGKPRSPPLKHNGVVKSAAFNAAGTRVVTASEDGTARVWDADTGVPSPPLWHPGVVVSAEFDTSGTHVLTVSESTPIVSDVANRKPASEQGFAAPDDRIPLTARVWNATTGALLSKPLQYPKRDDEDDHAVFDPGGTQVVTFRGGTARVWNAMTGRLIAVLQQQSSTTASPRISDQKQPPSTITSVAFSSDGTRVVTASDDGTAQVWDASSGAPVGRRLAHHGAVSSAVFSVDVTRVLTVSGDGTVRVWDASTGEPLSPPLVGGSLIAGARFSSDGSRVVNASEDGTARVWDALSGKLLLPALRHGASVRIAMFSMNGDRVATVSDETVRVWDLPLARGALEDWRKTVDSASPYVLSNGILSLRPASP